MKNKTLKLILAVSLLFNFSIIAAAGYFLIRDRTCQVSPYSVSRRHAVMAEKLNLSPEQQKALAESDERFRGKIEGVRNELAAKRQRLFALIKEDKPDRAAIDAVISEISGLQGGIEASVVEHILVEKAALGKEQQEAYMKLLEKRFNKARTHRDMRQGYLSPYR